MIASRHVECIAWSFFFPLSIVSAKKWWGSKFDIFLDLTTSLFDILLNQNNAAVPDALRSCLGLESPEAHDGSKVGEDEESVVCKELKICIHHVSNPLDLLDVRYANSWHINKLGNDIANRGCEFATLFACWICRSVVRLVCVHRPKSWHQ